MAFHESCSSPIALTLTPTSTVPTLARMMNSRAGTPPTSPPSFNHKGGEQMTLEKVRFGILGCGVIGPHHARAIAGLEDAELVAVADVVPELADKLEDFNFDPSYPDLKHDRTEDFVLIEILWSVGRSVKVKKKLLEDLMASLSRQGLNPENVMVCFKETTWENWSFGGGRLIHT